MPTQEKQPNQQNQSEVARLRAAIDAEYQASHLALYGLAQGVAQHEMITKRMERIQGHVEALSLVADPATMQEVMTRLGELEKAKP
jgi:hypothetical protein